MKQPRLFSDLMDWIFPRICYHCGERLEPDLMALCTLCRFYGYPLAVPTQLILPEPFACIRALWAFEKGGTLQRLIHAMKYGSLPQIGLELGECMGLQLLPVLFREFDVEPEEILLIPVPLHRRKEKKRGYNQAQLLCEGMQRIHPIRIAPRDWIIRRRFTRTQTGLAFGKRFENLEDAFELKEQMLEALDLHKVRVMLLVDDVYTTGATLFSLMKALEQGLAKSGIAGWRFGGVTLASGGL